MFYGVVVSVFLTLAVVPAVYVLVARNTRSPETVARLIAGLRAAARKPGQDGAAAATDSSNAT